jgi:hypothetical protein
LHPLVARKENVAGLKLIFCNYSHFVIGCREHCYIANLLAILYILPPCLMSIHVVFKWLKIYVLKNRWHGLVINSSLRYAMTDMTWWCTTQYRNFTLCILLLQLLRVSWKPDWVSFFFKHCPGRLNTFWSQMAMPLKSCARFLGF